MERFFSRFSSSSYSYSSEMPSQPSRKPSTSIHKQGRRPTPSPSKSKGAKKSSKAASSDHSKPSSSSHHLTTINPSTVSTSTTQTQTHEKDRSSRARRVLREELSTCASALISTAHGNSNWNSEKKMAKSRTRPMRPTRPKTSQGGDSILFPLTRISAQREAQPRPQSHQYEQMEPEEVVIVRDVSKRQQQSGHERRSSRIVILPDASLENLPPPTATQSMHSHQSPNEKAVSASGLTFDSDSDSDNDDDSVLSLTPPKTPLTEHPLNRHLQPDSMYHNLSQSSLRPPFHTPLTSPNFLTHNKQPFTYGYPAMNSAAEPPATTTTTTPQSKKSQYRPADFNMKTTRFPCETSHEATGENRASVTFESELACNLQCKIQAQQDRECSIAREWLRAEEVRMKNGMAAAAAVGGAPRYGGSYICDHGYGSLAVHNSGDKTAVKADAISGRATRLRRTTSVAAAYGSRSRSSAPIDMACKIPDKTSMEKEIVVNTRSQTSVAREKGEKQRRSSVAKSLSLKSGVRDWFVRAK